MNWKHGYFADSGYTYGYYPETMPWRLHWAATIQDQRAPLHHFRYLDAGCGQGYNLIMAAICHPESEFVGIDFMPEHIAHAKELAHRCGLKNVRFIEGDFMALAEDPQDLGEFDYAVCHGIATWVSPVVRTALFRMVGKLLKAGGIFYNSYNTLPGWLTMLPFQHLVTLEQRTKTGTAAITAAQTGLANLKGFAPAMINALPGMEKRVESMKTQDPSYLLQEYNNTFWEPLFVSQMIDAMSDVKLNYLGTATLSESFDGLLPKALRELLAAQDSVVMREQYRDYALNQSFRRDLYVKGRQKLWPQEKAQLLHQTRFVINPLAKVPAEGEAFEIKGGVLTISGKSETYGAIYNVIKKAGAKGASFGEVVSQYTDPQERSSILSILTLMVQSAYLMPVLDKAPNIQAISIQLAKAAMAGAPYKYLSLPAAGTAITMSEHEWILLSLDINKVPAEQWPTKLQEILKTMGRSLLKDGVVISDEATLKSLVDGLISNWMKNKSPLLRQMKVM